MEEKDLPAMMLSLDTFIEYAQELASLYEKMDQYFTLLPSHEEAINRYESLEKEIKEVLKKASATLVVKQECIRRLCALLQTQKEEEEPRLAIKVYGRTIPQETSSMCGYHTVGSSTRTSIDHCLLPL